MHSKSRVSGFRTSKAAALLHEVGGDIGGAKFIGVGSGLKEDNHNHVPVGVVLRKGHEHELHKELIIKGFLSQFSVLHSKKCEVHIHVIVVGVLLFKHSYFCKKCGYPCMHVCMLSL